METCLFYLSIHSFFHVFIILKDIISNDISPENIGIEGPCRSKNECINFINLERDNNGGCPTVVFLAKGARPVCVNCLCLSLGGLFGSNNCCSETVSKTIYDSYKRILPKDSIGKQIFFDKLQQPVRLSERLDETEGSAGGACNKAE